MARELQAKLIESNSLMAVVLDESGSRVLGLVTLHDLLRAQSALVEGDPDETETVAG